MPEWTLLRTKTGFTDDTDHVDVQSSPPEVELYRAGTYRAGAQLCGLQVLVVWVDSSGEVVTPDAGTDRGEFDMELLKVLDLHDGDTPPDETVVIANFDGIADCEGYQIYEFDGMNGTNIWLRFSMITEPATGSPASMQVWVAPIERVSYRPAVAAPA